MPDDVPSFGLSSSGMPASEESGAGRESQTAHRSAPTPLRRASDDDARCEAIAGLFRSGHLRPGPPSRLHTEVQALAASLSPPSPAD